MSEILEFFKHNFGSVTWVAVFLVAMLPIAEAKVAIPFGMSKEIWGSAALSPFSSAFVSFIGSMLPAFLILLFLKPIIKYLKTTKLFKKIATHFEVFFKNKASKERQKTSNNLHNKNKAISFLTLVFFVAIPLPLAGVWTSSAVACFSDIKYWHAILAIAIGNLFEVLFMTLLSVLFINSLALLLLVTVCLVCIYIIVLVVVHSKSVA